MEKLCFVLTKNGFQVDEAVAVSTDKCCASKEAFTSSPYETLYEQAFQERPAFFDAAGIFSVKWQSNLFLIWRLYQELNLAGRELKLSQVRKAWNAC